MRLPVVAIVGRPNVGKSTLFNRLAHKALAIVEDEPGVTRDRQYAHATWGETLLTLIDTGGFVPDERELLRAEIREQAQLAVEESDVILLVVDGRDGLTAADQEVAAYLRESGKPTVVVVNKVDDARKADQACADFFALGTPHVLDVSSAHGRGVVGLKEQVLALLPEQTPEPEVSPDDPDRPIRLAIVGRPNVGKSTLINALVGNKRLITSDVAGTTRDPIDVEVEQGGRRFTLTDTAGIRRKSAISRRVEKYSVVAALNAIDRSDVAVVVLDATEPGVEQDARILSIAEDKGLPVILVVNKWDRVKDKAQESVFRDWLKHELDFVNYAPVLFTTASTGTRVGKLLPLAADLFDQAGYRAATPQLNRLLEHVTTEHPAPWAQGRALRLYYCAQVAARPPTFMFLCNQPKAVPDRYQRYLLNQLRSTFQLRVPVRLVFRERPGKARRTERVATFKARKRHRRRKG